MKVILVPGWGFLSTIFDPLVRLLNTRLDCRLYDYPGYNNDENREYPNSLNILADDLLSDSSEQKICLIGWSYGGTLALLASSRSSCHIESVITIASMPCYFHTHTWPGISEDVFSWVTKGIQENSMSVYQRYANWQLIARNTNHRIAAYNAVLNDMCFEQKSLLSSLNHLREIDIRDQLSRVKCKHFHFLARHDYILPWSTSDKVISLYGHNRVLVMDGPHCLFRYNVSSIAKYICQILGEY